MIKYLVEFLGTFIFLSVIFLTVHKYGDKPSLIDAIPIGIAIVAMIYFGITVSGAVYNPALSFALLIKKTITLKTFFGYVIAQLLAGFCALKFYEYNI